MKRKIRTVIGKTEGGIQALGPQSSVADAVHMMNHRNIGAVLIVDPEGSLLGIFTERDVLRRVIDGRLDYERTRLEDVMTSRVYCLTPDNTVEEALMLVNAHNCRHLPVLDDGRIVGMISIRDLTNTLVEDREHEIEQLQRYIAGDYGGR